MNFDKAYVISLEESYKRRERFFNSIKKHSLNVEWIKGMHGENIDIQAQKELGILTDNFTLKLPGSLGCLLSHLNVWEIIKNDPEVNCALIFEDDAVLCRNFSNKLKSIPDSALPQDWDMIWLGWQRINCTPVNKFFGKPNSGGKNNGHFCYVINSRSIEKMKSILLPYDNTSSKDVILRKNFHRFNAYFLLKRISRTRLIEWGSIRKQINANQRLGKNQPDKTPAVFGE